MINRTFAPYADLLLVQERFHGSFPVPDDIRENVMPPIPVARNHWPLKDVAISDAWRAQIEHTASLGYRMYAINGDRMDCLGAGVTIDESIAGAYHCSWSTTGGKP